MEFGICNLNSIPLRIEASNTSEMVSQVLFGECFTVLETKKQWLYVKLAFDGYRGWIDNKQVEEISKDYFDNLQNTNAFFLKELISLVSVNDKLIPLSIGATLPNFTNSHFSINNNSLRLINRISFDHNS